MSAPLRPLAITMGDPCGIGPEIVLKAFASGLPAPAVAVGDAALLAREAARLALPVRVVPVAAPGDGVPAGRPTGRPAQAVPAGGTAQAVPTGGPAQAVPTGGPAQAVPTRHAGDAAPATVPVLDVGALPDDLPVGRVDARGGDAAYRCIVKAASLALHGDVRAVVTAPISKAAMQLAGHDYPGHTELLAELAGGVPVRMMLANAELRTVLVTIHVALRRALDLLTPASVLETIEIADHALRRAGIVAPRIAVAGVNPHAGEDGRFGREEIDVVAPAIDAARARGIDATGPHPPDTVFMRARGFRAFDAVVAMYHDQGLIPVKYLGIDDGVNVTIGLPFVRTSPDHGTAFDIAGRPGPDGRGLADPRSLLAAVREADAMSRVRTEGVRG